MKYAHMSLAIFCAIYAVWIIVRNRPSGYSMKPPRSHPVETEGSV